MFRLSGRFTTPILCVAYAFAAVEPRADLVIVNRDIAPDGFNRSAVLADGVFPGPLIVGKKDGHFSLNVINELNDTSMLTPTSIHWHGLFQKGTNWADGPSFINQCPIVPENSFLYDFHVPRQAGTFWYHSHLSTQYCDGLRGPLVVYDHHDPHRHLYDVDNEKTVITLSDWYHDKAPTLLFPTFMSTLINGRGRYAGGPSTALSVVNVRQGKRYRIRLVSISCDPNWVFSIDNHSLLVIEVDAVNTNPILVSSIQIFAGQRYSFVLHANQPIDNYWVRANPNIGTLGFNGGLNSAILRYKGAPEVEPNATVPATTNTTGLSLLQEQDLVPLENPGAPGRPVPGGADVNINFNVTFNATDLKFEVNGKTFVPPTVPVLLQILSGAQDATDLMPAGSVYTLPPNKVIEFSFPAGAAGGPHPIHLHGHTFDVVRSAGMSTYNYVNPPRRDVVNTGSAGDNVTIRFKTDNPGPWFLHCHIDWHLEAGFAIVFAEGTKRVKTTNHPPPAWDQLCPKYNDFLQSNSSS
ncbi:laccase, multicopper oxidase, benzenediol:oxygen oxidorectuctase [Stygiomarasmius scandens]|uniref:Laccase, multicopper oxidase, benzenediol:oxygen oxidorectuctase n=1 Tax=Marasmiellus scandens TaxID=2682957 RepID=A0ABR1IZL7_9AGAR